MSKIKCDENCFECPYPDVPAKCLARPIEPWESKLMNRAHRKIPQGRSEHEKDYNRRYMKAAWEERRFLAEQACIAKIREARGMMQCELAAAIGCKNQTLCSWEKGALHANWDKLCAVLPELEEYRPKGGKK